MNNFSRVNAMGLILQGTELNPQWGLDIVISRYVILTA